MRLTIAISLLVVLPTAIAQSQIPQTRCLTPKQYEKLPAVWRTFSQIEFSSFGYSHKVYVYPPNGSAVLLYCPGIDGKPRFAFARVTCFNSKPISLKYDAGVPLQCNQWLDAPDHWLPLIAPQIKTPTLK